MKEESKVELKWILDYKYGGLEVGDGVLQCHLENLEKAKTKGRRKKIERIIEDCKSINDSLREDIEEIKYWMSQGVDAIYITDSKEGENVKEVEVVDKYGNVMNDTMLPDFLVRECYCWLLINQEE